MTDGDAVQHVWSVPDRGGLTLVEVMNDSPLSFAVAFSGLPVLTDRPPSEMPVQGIDLPADAFVMPVGHHASVRVAIPHEPERWVGHPLSEVHADRAGVVAGWTATVDRASRLDVPDERLVGDVVEARCDLLLTGPVRADDDPVGFVLDVAELVRLGEPADTWLPEVVAPIESTVRNDAAGAPGDVEAVLVAGQRIAAAAGDDRAARDIARIRSRRSRTSATASATATAAGPETIAPFSQVVRGRSAGRFVREVERRLVSTSGSTAELLPIGVPTPWLGVGFEVHGVPAGTASTVSFAVRWHGERPALLWEQVGDPLQLRASAVDGSWSTDERSGEALWAAPARPRNIPVVGAPADGRTGGTSSAT